jgi:cyanophycin synthetase
MMEGHGVSIHGMRVLRGPNLFAYMPVLQVTLDIGPFEQQPSSNFPGFTERIVGWLPGLQTHECSLNRPGGFIERLQRGTYLAHIVEHVAIELQSMMGFDVTFGRALNTDRRGVYDVIVAYKEEEAAREAFETALRMTLAALHDEPFDAEAEIERLLTLADRYRLGPSTAAIVDAARRRNIPITRLTPQGSLVQLGWGVNQQRIWASETSNTCAIAVELCQEKPLTNRLLRMVGLPVPEGESVTTADAAWRAAQAISGPVVVKPDAGNQGKGVSTNLSSEADVRSAFDIARRFGQQILVERFVEGDDHRLLVVAGKLVAAARRAPAMVTGDGKRTIRELVEEVNRDPRRRDGHSSTLTRIKLDEAATLVLQQQSLTVDSVPELGQQVKLRLNSNLSTGGTAIDVTDIVHPSNRRVAELAAQFLALDVAGIDIVCRDIRRPLAEQGGAIVEVNAAPGLRMHIHPAEGTPRDPGPPIVDMLYPDKASARIPIVAITGTNGKTTTTRLVAHIFETARKVVGMTSTNGVYINKERLMTGDCSGPKSARAVLLHPHVEVAVLETARGGILREGLAFDRCTVGVVLNVTSDHLGTRGINTLEDLAKVKQVVIENVARDGTAVLNADDPLVAQMAAVCDGRVIYFSSRPGSAVVAAHLDAGERAVLIENNAIVMATGDERNELIDLASVPFTYNGAIRFQVENALAAVAAAWGAGVNPAMIARALTTFTTDGATVPGRFNINEVSGVQVIVDYGHNPAAMTALGQALDAIGKRRTLLVLGLPGDRRDDDLIATMDASLAFTDEYLLFDTDRRGRADGEVTSLLMSRISDGRAASVVRDEFEGIERAWRQARPGDRIILIAEEVDAALERIAQLAGPSAADVCVAPIAAESYIPASAW